MADAQRDVVEETVQRLAELHAEHQRNVSPLRRAVVRFTCELGRPAVLFGVLALLVLWIGVNGFGRRLGVRPFDAPPFGLLELLATVAALLTTLMILATQQREEEASRHRSQLTLQLASLVEQKVAKVIELLEEQRRDLPQLPTRPDPQAEEMSRPADPRRVLERIKDTHEDG
jgi:uncharacterized membrane protein